MQTFRATYSRTIGVAFAEVEPEIPVRPPPPAAAERPRTEVARLALAQRATVVDNRPPQASGPRIVEGNALGQPDRAIVKALQNLSYRKPQKSSEPP